MRAVEFPGSNIVYGANQPEYFPLPAMRIPGPEGNVITCWELSDAELAEITRTKRIYFSQFTFNEALQPVRAMAGLEDTNTL